MAVPVQVRGRMDAIIAAEGLAVTDEGRQALLDLSGGDMRRVLNVMQVPSLTCRKPTIP